jgi:Aspartyl protease
VIVLNLRVAPLRFMYVCINDTLVKTLVDSGAQVTIIRRDILPDTELKYVGSNTYKGYLVIQLRPISHQ